MVPHRILREAATKSGSPPQPSSCGNVLQDTNSKIHKSGDSSLDIGDSEDDAQAVTDDNEQQPSSRDSSRKIDRTMELSPRQLIRSPLESSQIYPDVPLTPHSPLFLPPLKSQSGRRRYTTFYQRQWTSLSATAFSMMAGRTINRSRTAPRRALHSLGRSLNTGIARFPSLCAAGLFKRPRNPQRPQRSPYPPQRRCGPMWVRLRKSDD